MEYLGFLLSAEGIRPDPRKVEAIMALKAPKNRKELRHFAGPCQLYPGDDRTSLGVHVGPVGPDVA